MTHQAIDRVLTVTQLRAVLDTLPDAAAVVLVTLVPCALSGALEVTVPVTLASNGELTKTHDEVFFSGSTPWFQLKDPAVAVRALVLGASHRPLTPDVLTRRAGAEP